jgi:hypothetical protein
MAQKPVLFLIMALLAIAIAFSGCTSQPAAPVTPVATTVATTIVTTVPVPATPVVNTTAAPVKPVTTDNQTKPAIQNNAEKVILNTKGLISPKDFKTFDFASMGEQFSQLGVKYRITVIADKPVIGYAVDNMQVPELPGNEMTPQYVSGSDKIQWGLITPYMTLGKVTNSTQTFTVDKIAPYVYVLDGRWMQFDNDYKNTTPFNYQITITKIYNPNPDATPLKY